jgi:methyl-accepting chemotaxis protein
MVPTLLSRSSRTTIAIGLLLPVVLIGIPALLTFRAERQLKHAFEMVTHTLAVERAVQSLASSIVDAETGQRGFLLTRRELYLGPYEAGRARVGQQVSDLRLLTADNPQQQQRLDEMQPLLRERLELLDQTVALGRRGEFDAALEMVNSDRGKERMDKIRGILRVMDDDERRLLWMRRQEAAKQARRNTWMLSGLLVAAVACAGVVFYLLRRLSQTEPVVNMCAYSRTIEYEGEWISFEEYLHRRFNVTAIQGMSPSEFDRMRAAVRH